MKRPKFSALLTYNSKTGHYHEFWGEKAVHGASAMGQLNGALPDRIILDMSATPFDSSKEIHTDGTSEDFEHGEKVYYTRQHNPMSSRCHVPYWWWSEISVLFGGKVHYRIRIAP